MEIRALAHDDIEELVALEREVWGKRGIESVDRDTAERWIGSGIAFGCFDSERLAGYAYGEAMCFEPLPPYSAEILAALRSYKETSPSPEGNALHGLSMAARKPGAGGPLLEALMQEAKRRSFRYFVSLARLEGFGRFLKDHPEAQSFALPEAACFYAMQAVAWAGRSLIGSPLSLLEIPPGFPKLGRKDPVASRFARIGKELWGVAESSFADPQSLGFSALLVLTL